VPSFSRKFLPEIGLSVLEWVIFVQEIIEFVMIVLPPDAFLILIVARKGILGTPIPITLFGSALPPDIPRVLGELEIASKRLIGNGYDAR
jgi:hypothetical protein